MIVVPAIDVRAGKVVRLRQGRPEEETSYGSDPAEAARRWEAEGAERLHLVDLDAAIDRRPQPGVVGAVVVAVGIPVEVGGGLRTVDAARRYRDVGVERLIFGTAAVTTPEVVEEAVDRWPEAVAVAIDARGGRVTVAGWKEDTALDALELGSRVKAWGVGRVQFTDVGKDGTLDGPNVEAIEKMARETGLRITAAGGVSTLDDLVRLSALAELGVDEAISGKALYDGRFTLAEARSALSAVGKGR
ncbi:MAG: 1-(5-phosphoribosyl)-5-[(5-phosphoribosylamino)methylideneamino]imidazole-4-carboxamide isomerase [Acidobacteria bacterium]|nr:1-(5-phosphoribosyl)-5-[(5-phosphoribosylamino)methylideneamino]imidazole-4-carboxamide isomerase [Acidobacteriota bacterium]